MLKNYFFIVLSVNSPQIIIIFAAITHYKIFIFMLFQFYKIQIHKRDANLEGADFSKEISDFKSYFIGTKINAYTDGVRPNDPPTLYENRIYRDKVTGDLVLMQLCSNKKVSRQLLYPALGGDQ